MRTDTSFESICESHFDAIFRYVLRRVGNVPEAEDLTAQTFFKALRSIERVRFEDGSVSAWLYRIATHEVASHYRRVRRRGESGLSSTTGIAREIDDAERQLARHEMFLTVHRALRTLGDEDQALIALRYFEHKRFAEIAEILGKRAGTVTMRAHRALSKLRRELERRGMDHEGLREILERPAEAGC